MKEREKEVKDLALRCRPLVVTLCSAFCAVIILFGTAVVAATSSSRNRNATNVSSDYFLLSRLHFKFLTVGSFLGAILCALFITATFVMRISLAIPYFVLHIVFSLYLVYQIISYFRITVTQQNALYMNDSENPGLWSEFGIHVLHHHGAFPIFSGFMILSLFIYTVLPMWSFIHELYVYRKEKKADEKILARQREAELLDERFTVLGRHLKATTESSTGNTNTPPSTQEDSSYPEVVIKDRRESKMYPLPPEGFAFPDVGERRKKSHRRRH